MTTLAPDACDTLTNLIGGQDIASQGTEYTTVYNPSTGEALAKTPHSTVDDVDNAVAVAQAAFASWRDTPAPKRAAIMFAYQAIA